MHFIPINFSDPGFNPVFTADFELLIVLNEHNFSYAVRHPATQRLVRLSNQNELNCLFDPEFQTGLLVSSYQKVIVAADTNSFCLIPDAVFTPENLLDFAAFLSVKTADKILTDEVETGENVVIFTFPEALIAKIEAQYPDTKILFAPKTWIKNMIEAQQAQHNLYLLIEEHYLQLLFLEEDKIRFYNKFSYNNQEEMIYYTALVTNQLKLKPEETNLVVCGKITTDDELLLHLKEFFNEAVFFNAADLKQHNLLQQHQIVDFINLN